MQGAVLVTVPTLNAERTLAALLDGLETQTLAFDLCFVDSSSTDQTLAILTRRGFSPLVIPRSEFNHGGTRQLMVDRHPEYDFYVFLTQDVVLDHPEALEYLVRSMSNPSVGAAYGRQLPRVGGSVLECQDRAFNYPEQSFVKSEADKSTWGLKTPFMSNAFGAYRREALVACGGFPRNVILAEDMYLAARMLRDGWLIAYVAEARCRHSHGYTLREEFRRYFDIGAFHAQNPWIRESFGSGSRQGLDLVYSMLFAGSGKRILNVPIVLTRVAARALGFRLGLMERWLPVAPKRFLSMNSSFWN